MNFLAFIIIVVAVFYFMKPSTPEPQRPAVTISSQSANSTEPTQEQKIAASAAEDARCRDDLKCTAEKTEVEARVRCGRKIEQRAKYDFKWTEPGWFGTYGPIFESYSWSNKSAQIVDYSGDKVQFQNGFGAFMRMSYICTFNTITKEVKDLSLYEGRL